jgi:hypothetical protein
VNANRIASAKEVLKVFSEESRMRARAVVMMGKFIVVTPLRIYFFQINENYALLGEVRKKVYAKCIHCVHL